MYIKMVQTKIIEKDGKPLISTKDGRELIELRLEEGDVFIPIFNSVTSNKKEVLVKGKKKSIINYSIKAILRDKTGKDFIDRDGNKEVWVSLTPTQAKSIQKKLDEGILINQELFHAYEYESIDFPDEKFIGVGIRGSGVKAKTFDDFNYEIKADNIE